MIDEGDGAKLAEVAGAFVTDNGEKALMPAVMLVGNSAAASVPQLKFPQTRHRNFQPMVWCRGGSRYVEG